MTGKKISVFGGSLITGYDTIYHDAREAGKCLVREGFEVYNGGYGGIMEAVSRGAAEAGGKTVGVTCSIFGNSPPNRYIRQEIRCSNLYKRLEVLIESVDAYLVFPGSTGTMAEIILSVEVTSKFALPRPLIFWGNYWKDFIDRIEKLAIIGDKRIPLSKSGKIDKLPIEYVDNCEELIKTVKKYFTG